MLTGVPTQNLTGIGIYGDAHDLSCLYKTIHKLAGDIHQMDEPMHKVLMGFAHEIRKAAQGIRMEEKFENLYSKEFIYRGFNYLWTDVLVISNVLRLLASRKIVSELDQSNMYIFEWILKSSLDTLKGETPYILKEYIGRNLAIDHKLLNPITELLGLTFLSLNSLQDRFHKIPSLLNDYFNPYSEEHKKITEKINADALVFECTPSEVTYLEDYPENIIW